MGDFDNWGGYRIQMDSDLRWALAPLALILAIIFLFFHKDPDPNLPKQSRIQSIGRNIDGYVIDSAPRGSTHRRTCRRWFHQGGLFPKLRNRSLVRVRDSLFSCPILERRTQHIKDSKQVIGPASVSPGVQTRWRSPRYCMWGHQTSITTNTPMDDEGRGAGCSTLSCGLPASYAYSC